MGRWDKYDVCPKCRAATGVRCWIIRRAPGVPWTSVITDMPANRKHDARPLLPVGA